MSEICAFNSCGSIQFKLGLCKDHYAAIAGEALKEAAAPAAKPTPPVLQTALYLFNRFTDGVIERYRKAFEVSDDEMLRIHLDGAEQHVRSGDVGKATESLVEATRIAPESATLNVSLGDLRLREGSYEDALACYRAAQQAGAPEASVGTKIAEALCGLGRYQDALAHLETALADDPENSERHYRHGAALEAIGQLEEALEAYRHAAELDPEEPRYHQALGFGLEALGRHEDALHCFKTALELER